MEAGGVTVVATANAWRFDEGLTDVATPLYFFIANDGPDALDLQYVDFGLVDENGKVYSALPPSTVVRILFGGSAVAPPLPEAAGHPPLRGAPTPPQLGSPGPWAMPGYGVGPYEAWPWPGPWGWPWGWGFGPYPGYSFTYRGVHPILALGLHPGPLPPDSFDEGFVFFQPAWKAKLVNVRFQATREHAPPLTMHARFQVRR